MEAKVEAIMEAARALFAARGFDATSVQDIAARAGVAAGTVMYHFKSKENLLFITARQTFASLVQALLAAAEAAPGPWRALEGMTRAYFRHARANIESLQTICRDDPFLRLDVSRYPRADLVLFRDRCLELIEKELERGFKSGEFQRAPSPETAAVIRSLWAGCARALVWTPSLQDPSDEVVAFLAARLLVPATAGGAREKTAQIA